MFPTMILCNSIAQHMEENTFDQNVRVIDFPLFGKETPNES